jgi:hypothetical protein
MDWGERMHRRHRGHVSHGVVIIDDGATLPEGAQVNVEVVEDVASKEQASDSLADRLKRLAGSAKDLPTDLARNHDHYLHGQGKR